MAQEFLFIPMRFSAHYKNRVAEVSSIGIEKVAEMSMGSIVHINGVHICIGGHIKVGHMFVYFTHNITFAKY